MTERVEEFVGVSSEEVNELASDVDEGKGGAFMVGGKKVEGSIKTSLSSVTLVYLDAAVKVQCFDSDGNEIPLSGESRFEVRRGDVVRVTVAGFKPGSTVKAAIFSDPVALGTITADGNGDGIQQWKVPDSLAPGKHTLIATGDLVDADDAVFGLRVIVDEPSFVSRVTSSTVARVILVLGVLLGLIIPATRRRREKPTPVA